MFTWYCCEILYLSEILAPVQQPGWPAPAWHFVVVSFVNKCRAMKGTHSGTKVAPVSCKNPLTISFSFTTFKIDLQRGRCHLDNPHIPVFNKYIRITTSFILSTFTIDFQGAGVTWTTHASSLVISTSEWLSYLAQQHLKLTFKGRVSLGQPTCPRL